MSDKVHIFTSESVSEGHPDKVADQISDAILDAILTEDKHARVACETMVTTGLAIVAGEVTTSAKVEYRDIIRETIKEIGYVGDDMKFDYESCGVMVSLGKQSADIAMGVNVGEGADKEQGAGDQGLMFGYACDHTDVLMPMPVHLSHKLVKRLADARKAGEVNWLRPDAKSQVSIKYVNDRPVSVDTVVLSTQHAPDVSQKEIKEFCIENIVKDVISEDLLTDDTIYHINPTGQFIIGGPHGDAGLTGRKIIVDTYGGHGSHGGGAFSGKDPSKVDRSASYMGRYIAKNIVAAGLASECEVQLAYAIGVADPVSVMVDTFGTSKIEETKIEELIKEHFSCKPADIISHLDLLRPIYRQTAAYGHFGRTGDDFTWEKTDKAEVLKKAAGL